MRKEKASFLNEKGLLRAIRFAWFWKECLMRTMVLEGMPHENRASL
jgi:hypothetical protein